MRDNKGFTLIELLIVVVIIGILAAIAIPKFSATREKAYYAALKSDIKNLSSQEEIYYSDHYQYTTSTTNLGFVQSEGVTVTIPNADANGWEAQAVHAGLEATEGCSMYYGTITPTVTLGSPTQPGEVACTG